MMRASFEYKAENVIIYTKWQILAECDFSCIIPDEFLTRFSEKY